MKTDIEYLNYDELNYIEERVQEAVFHIKLNYAPDMPLFTRHTWELNELPYIQQINRIEEGIESVGYWGIKPDGWIETKKWITSDNLYPIKSFDYTDYNRWINNLDLTELRDLSGLTLWNGISQITWDIESQYEWEE